MPKADRTILYIEDNHANLMLVEKVIAMIDGVVMLSASSGEEGLELLRSTSPDLVLLDINLPGIDGFDVLHAIRADEAYHDVPVVAMSASASRAELAEGLSAGFDNYLTKPFDVRLFMRVVREYLELQAPPSGEPPEKL
jgi:CheY-like chemotaxis protein